MLLPAGEAGSASRQYSVAKGRSEKSAVRMSVVLLVWLVAAILSDRIQTNLCLRFEKRQLLGVVDSTGDVGHTG